MARVLLINPPQTYYPESQGFSAYFPVGLLSIAAVLRDRCEVKVLDCLVEQYAETEAGGMRRYGTPPDEIRRIIGAFEPDIVGISVPFTAQYTNARDVGLLAGVAAPGALIVMGGPDPSVRSGRILEEGVADICVLGEGEMTMAAIVEAFDRREPMHSISGVAMISEGETVTNDFHRIDSLDDLPLPAYDLVDMEAYFNHAFLYRNRSHIHTRSISVITSRGCPYNCVFCSIKLHMGRKFRAHSPEYVLRHLELLIERYNIRRFHFEDDNISMDPERFAAILDGIIARGWNIEWDTPNGIRADTLDEALLERIKRTGCRQLTLAIESGSRRVLNELIRKNTDLDRVIEIAALCKKLDIRTNSFYVIGFPGEKPEEMRETTALALRLIREVDMLPTMLVATPLYGTELYDISMKNNYIVGNPSPEELAKATQLFGRPLIATEDFSTEDIETILGEYFSSLKKELAFFSLRHPAYALRRLKQKLPILLKLLKRN